jgi:Icc-related predicted phosphoesterase
MAEPERKIKVLTVSDIHSVGSLLDELKAAVERHGPDVLAFVGDLLDADAFGSGMLRAEECARRIAGLRVEKVIFVRGNHEHWNWFNFQAAWQDTGRELVTLHGEAFVEGPLVIVGFPCLLGDEDAFRGERPIHGPPDKWLNPLVKKYGAAMQTLWLMHEPPRGTPLAQEIGVIAGNREWMKAVKEYSPKVVVFGHDHNTPIKKGIWHHKLESGTVCVNVGQDSPLRYTLIEMVFDGETPRLPKRIAIRRDGTTETIEVTP